MIEYINEWFFGVFILINIVFLVGLINFWVILIISNMIKVIYGEWNMGELYSIILRKVNILSSFLVIINFLCLIIFVRCLLYMLVRNCINILIIKRKLVILLLIFFEK